MEPDGGSARLEVGRRSLESLLNVVLAAGREGSVGLGVSSWRWHQALPGRKTLAAFRARRQAQCNLVQLRHQLDPSERNARRIRDVISLLEEYGGTA